MDDNLLEIICCPETHQPLRHADAELVTDLNQRIEAELTKRNYTLGKDAWFVR